MFMPVHESHTTWNILWPIFQIKKINIQIENRKFININNVSEWIFALYLVTYIKWDKTP